MWELGVFLFHQQRMAFFQVVSESLSDWSLAPKQLFYQQNHQNSLIWTVQQQHFTFDAWIVETWQNGLQLLHPKTGRAISSLTSSCCSDNSWTGLVLEDIITSGDLERPCFIPTPSKIIKRWMLFFLLVFQILDIISTEAIIHWLACLISKKNSLSKGLLVHNFTITT